MLFFANKRRSPSVWLHSRQSQASLITCFHYKRGQHNHFVTKLLRRTKTFYCCLKKY